VLNKGVKLLYFWSGFCCALCMALWGRFCGMHMGLQLQSRHGNVRWKEGCSVIWITWVRYGHLVFMEPQFWLWQSRNN